ncbi:hypothetical protein V8C42DRAFT_334641 [Trichoderma barbatum]
MARNTIPTAAAVAYSSAPAILDRESTPWETLQQLEDERLSNTSAVIRELLYGYMYAHLENEYIDWELDGNLVCRVVGSECYGHVYRDVKKMERHLKNPYHMAHNAAQPPRQQTPPPRSYMRQDVRIQIAEGNSIPEAPNQDSTMSEIPGNQELFENPDSRDILEILDSEDVNSEVTGSQLLEIPESDGISSEFTSSQIPISPVTSVPAQEDISDESESESIKSVIFVKECKVTNCQQCIAFTISTDG